MSGFIFLPLATAMMILAKPIIQLLFERGAFDAAATELTSKILTFSCLQLFPICAVGIMLRLLFAFQDFGSIFKVLLVNLAANLILNFTLIKLMNPPACGIALAAAAGSFITATLYFAILKKRISNLHGLTIFWSLSKITIFSALSGMAVFFTYTWMNGIFHDTVLTRSLNLAAATGAGILIFLSAAAAFKLPEFLKVYHLTRTKLGTNPADAV
jgi:putative peptidoglycan lipid II flippase